MSEQLQGLLRPGLLEGVGIALAANEGGSRVSARALSGLGARVVELALPDVADPQELQEAVDAAVGETIGSAGVGTLVVDTWATFAAGGAEGLDRCMAGAWSVVRAVANAAFLPDDGDSGGRIVLLAPPAGPEHAAAAAAGLENLARTLSIEWARFGLTTVAVAPAARTSEQELTTLAAYLASPAGAYFSGCLLDLRGPGAVEERQVS